VVLASTLFAEEGDYAETIPDSKVTFDMIWVPEGKFWIGKTEVTWAEFLIWYEKKDLPEGADAGMRPSPHYEMVDHGWGKGQRPAVGMSRRSAELYCEWLSKRTGKGYRLPTEKEWEQACGSLTDPVEDYAWFSSTAPAEKTQKVATRKPNARGIHDMLGNAWEWVSDPWSAEDPTGVLKGGAYDSEEVSPEARQKYLDAWDERDAHRPRSTWWVYDGPFIGFRVARTE